MAAGGWTRDIESPFEKTRVMADGEMTALLLSQAPAATVFAALVEPYKELQKTQEQLSKALIAHMAANAFALGVYSNAIETFSSSGMKLTAASFAHAALILLSVTGLWLTSLFTKSQYARSWIEYRFEASDAAGRAYLLLHFPAAFWYFRYAPGVRGYPRNIWPERSELWGLPSLFLMLAALAIVSVGGAALWVMIAIEVWNAAYPTPVAAKATVVVCVILAALAATAPRFGVKRAYRLYSLPAVLASGDDAAKVRAHARIARARLRMGWVPKD